MLGGVVLKNGGATSCEQVVAVMMTPHWHQIGHSPIGRSMLWWRKTQLDEANGEAQRHCE